MGSIISSLSSPSPSDSTEQNPKTTTATTTTAAAATTMSQSASDKPKVAEQEPPTTDLPKTLETETLNQQQSTDPIVSNNENGNQEAEEEEEGECGFCLFMKGGECKETFINWEKCVEEGEKNDEDIVDKCFEVTSALKKCMEAHPDYYGVILQAEKDAEQEVHNQLDQQKEEVAAGLNSGDEQQKQQKEQKEEIH